MKVKRNNIFLYAICAAICVLSYIILNQNIEFTLMPHKTAMEYLFNFNFEFMENVGYRQTNGLFIIARDCLGGKLFVSLFLITILGFLHRYIGLKRKIAAVIKFYFISLIAAFTATVIRISASVPFCAWEKFHLIHNIISIVIYFASGLILYFVIEKILERKLVKEL